MYRYSMARRALSLIEIPCLSGNINEEDIIRTCNSAGTPYGTVASVCVPSKFVGLARQQLAETNVRVATVANFPSGKQSLARIGHDVEIALAMYADEIALVIPWQDWLKGEREETFFLIERIKGVCKGKSLLRAIIEVEALEKTVMIEETALAMIRAGVDFIQTSTGRSNDPYRPEYTNIILNAIAAEKRPVGMVVAGEINSFDQILDNLTLTDAIVGEEWTHQSSFRFQTARFVTNLVKTLDELRPKRSK